MDQKELEIKYAALLADPNFDQLSLRSAEPNLFKILGISSYEIRHSNFLAWLLDPKESHGLGDYFLMKVLQNVLLDERAEGISIIELGSLNLNKVEIRREWQNIDLLIITENFVVCIENKIWSGENGAQLIKYKKIIDEHFPEKEHKKCFVFLTPYGADASENRTYINYSYSSIIEILTNVINSRGDFINGSVRTYIKDYITSINQTIMSDDSSNLMAKQLYINHKDLFNFIWQNKPDVWDDFAIELKKKLKAKGWLIGSKNKGYVRFYTPRIESLILKYNKANGWPDKEGFLFEFDFYEGKRLIFKTVISPSVGDSSYCDKLNAVFNEIEDVRNNLGDKWKLHYLKDIIWPLEKNMHEWEDEKQGEKLDSFIEKIEEAVYLFENKLLENEDDILSIINRIKEKVIR